MLSTATLVLRIRFELMTPWASTKCSTRLSYLSIWCSWLDSNLHCAVFKTASSACWDTRAYWVRRVDSNHRPLGYEPNKLTTANTPHYLQVTFILYSGIEPLDFLRGKIVYPILLVKIAVCDLVAGSGLAPPTPKALTTWATPASIGYPTKIRTWNVRVKVSCVAITPWGINVEQAYLLLNNVYYTTSLCVCQAHFRILWKFLFTVFSFL